MRDRMATMLVPMMKLTGFRFSKEYRWGVTPWKAIHNLAKGATTDPNYEVEAPPGYRWTGPVTGHFFVAWSKQEIQRTLQTATMERCPADCDCQEEA